MRKSDNPSLLFDLDGTLLDTVYAHVQAWSAALKTFDIPVPQWKIHRRIGMSGKSLIRQILREHPNDSRPDVDLDELEKKHDTEFKKIGRDAAPLPGAHELLEFPPRHEIRWAIATTGSQEQTKQLLQKLHLPSNAPVVTGDDVAKAKPSPDIFVLAAKRLKVNVSDCIVTGDSVWDVLAAGRKRALAVGLLTGGYSQDELERAGAFRVYTDPADMLLHIEDLGIFEK